MSKVTLKYQAKKEEEQKEMLPRVLCLLKAIKVLSMGILCSFFFMSPLSLADSTDPSVGPVSSYNFGVPLVVDAGVYNFVHPLSFFATNRHCASQYSPYFIFTPNITWPGDGGQAMEVTMSYLVDAGNIYYVFITRSYGGDSGGVAFSWQLICFPTQMGTPSYLPAESGFGNPFGF